MTKNQLQYQSNLISAAKVREESRANLAKEQETHRSNKTNEAIKMAGLAADFAKSVTSFL